MQANAFREGKGENFLLTASTTARRSRNQTLRLSSQPSAVTAQLELLSPL